MRKLTSFIIFGIVIGLTYYLLFVADMTWDENQKKIVPEAENTTIEEFNLNYQVAIEDLPASLVKKMKNQAIIHRAVAEALDENEEELKKNGYKSSDKIYFVGHDVDPNTGDMKLHFVFGKNEHKLTYNVIKGEPINYELTIVTIVEEE